MNDLAGNFSDAIPLNQYVGKPPRLAPPRAFSEAAAMVEEALNRLRAAETALEFQLAGLNETMKAASAAR